MIIWSIANINWWFVRRESRFSINVHTNLTHRMLISPWHSDLFILFSVDVTQITVGHTRSLTADSGGKDSSGHSSRRCLISDTHRELASLKNVFTKQNVWVVILTGVCGRLNRKMFAWIVHLCSVLIHPCIFFIKNELHIALFFHRSLEYNRREGLSHQSDWHGLPQRKGENLPL